MIMAIGVAGLVLISIRTVSTMKVINSSESVLSVLQKYDQDELYIK